MKVILKKMGFSSAFLIVSSFLLHLISVDSSSITFCDGTTKIEKTRDQCGSGYNFGDPKPACVCIKGIYRIWTDTCEVADGFAEEICTKLTDDRTKSNILGLRLSNDPKDWNQTGVVCDRKGFGKDLGWGFISEDPVPTTTSSDHIYVLNGQALMTPDGICVKPAKLPDNKKICKYLKKDNLFHWKQNDVTITIGADCTGKPLMSSACFGVLKSTSSECRLSCGGTSGPQGRSFGSFRKPPPQSGRSLGAPAAKGRTMAQNKGPLLPDADTMTNISNPADYRQHDNKFLNRKMLIFNVISQIETGDQANATADSKIPYIYGQPVKTFELFNLMKDIVKATCPHQYVNPDWIDMTIDLFYILHKGHVFRYDELVSQEQYEWIKDILMKCWDNLNSTSPTDPTTDPDKPVDPGTIPVIVPITGPSDKCSSAGGGVGSGTATGYCKPPEIKMPDPTIESDDTVDGEEGSSTPAPPGESCTYTPIKIDDDRANPAFHYVPDVAWDIVDMIQVRCFPQFNESYRMFHVLEQAAEKLFTLQIKNLWYYPGWSPKTKSKLLGAGADVQMRNLEMCVEAAYALQEKIPRLKRPPPPKYIRKRRAAPSESLTSMSKTSEAFCVKSQGDFVYPKNCKALPE